MHWEYSKAVGDYISRTGTCREKSVFLQGLWGLIAHRIQVHKRLIFYDDDRLKVVA